MTRGQDAVLICITDSPTIFWLYAKTKSLWRHSCR